MKSSIEKVIMTNDSCIYLTTAGDIFSGALPMHLDTSACLGKVVDVALGYEHKILLTDEGVVYTWGNGRRLQLGHGNLNNLDIPTVVTALSGVKIIKISAGGWHSCALSDIGDLYVWGWNDTGQLGVKLTTIDKGEQSFGIPVLVDLFCENGEEVHTHIKDVACGSRHTTILLEDGTLWTSGSNKYGQLGFSAETFEKVNHFKKAYQCCKSCTLLSGFWNTVIDTNSCRCSHWCGYDNVKEML
ncbi:unnamed protein product [Leptosia nina]|uniref:Uncharacterized protein n=1 Tax=Leptosia nina TaxID=320188 RepID=A0AAV1JK01_9NEOP